MSTRTHLIDLLQARAGSGYLSGARLADELGVSRTAVWKHVEALREEGFVIETVRSRGYRLAHSPDVVRAPALQRDLCTRWLGRALLCLDETGSTNSDAIELGRGGHPHGTVVVADAQRAGRGRLGRSWVSARGVNLYMSVLLRPATVPARAPQLSLVAGLAVARALASEALEPRIKWPNDVLLGGRKVCGILTEIEAEADRVSFVVVGIGVNVNATLESFPPELHDKATSIYLASGRRSARARIASRILRELEVCYDLWASVGFPALSDEWNARSSLAGRRVEVSGAGETAAGTCAGIDDDGVLLLRGDDGALRRVLAGDVTVVGGYD